MKNVKTDPVGIPLYAPAKGTIARLKETTSGGGLTVVVELDYKNFDQNLKVYIVYMHLYDIDDSLSVNDVVEAGDLLGISGGSGGDNGGSYSGYAHHLHYGIFIAPSGLRNSSASSTYWNGNPLNPLFFYEMSGNAISFDGTVEQLNYYYK